MKKHVMFLAVLAVCSIVAAAFAATVDLTTGSTAVRAANAPTPVVLEKTVNFATAGAVSGDVVRVLYVPAGTKINEVYYKMVTTNGVTTTVDIGDSTGQTRWFGAIDLVTATSGAVNSASNIFYTAADYVQVKLLGATPTKGTLLIKANAVVYGEVTQ